jgi:hypothetical protein
MDSIVASNHQLKSNQPNAPMTLIIDRLEDLYYPLCSRICRLIERKVHDCIMVFNLRGYQSWPSLVVGVSSTLVTSGRCRLSSFSREFHGENETRINDSILHKPTQA